MFHAGRLVASTCDWRALKSDGVGSCFHDSDCIDVWSFRLEIQSTTGLGAHVWRDCNISGLRHPLQAWELVAIRWCGTFASHCHCLLLARRFLLVMPLAQPGQMVRSNTAPLASAILKNRPTIHVSLRDPAVMVSSMSMPMHSWHSPSCQSKRHVRQQELSPTAQLAGQVGLEQNIGLTWKFVKLSYVKARAANETMDGLHFLHSQLNSSFCFKNGFWSWIVTISQRIFQVFLPLPCKVKINLQGHNNGNLGNVNVMLVSKDIFRGSLLWQ